MSVRIEPVGVFIDCAAVTLRRLRGHRHICHHCLAACGHEREAGLTMVECLDAEAIIDAWFEREAAKRRR